MDNKKSINPKKLLVEGASEKRVIPELMEKNGVPWPNNNKPVWIEESQGYEELIRNRNIRHNNDVINLITIQLKDSPPRLTHLGIIVDADDNELLDENKQPIERWQSLRNACLSAIPDLPKTLPPTGLIHVTQNNIKFGIWIMPDNQNKGMLETFLAYLVPDKYDKLWQFAQDQTQEAKNYEATFKNVHKAKADIYTWLAWQDEPGRQLHEAIKEPILNATHPKSQDFVNWFKRLYDLE